MNSKRTCLLALMFLVLSLPAVGQQKRYTLVDLGVIDKWYSQAAAINDRGEVAGFSSTATKYGADPFVGPPHAFFWTEKAGMRDLGTLAFGNIGSSNGAAINDLGQVVGQSDTFRSRPLGGPQNAFLFSEKDGMVDLGLLPGGFGSGAAGINNAGVVAGSADTVVDFFGDPFTPIHTFRYTRQGGMEDLGSLIGTLGLGVPDFGTSSPRAINERGQIVGISMAFGHGFDFAQHAFRFTEGVGMVDLGTLPRDGDYSEARAINNRGDVVGISIVPLPFDPYFSAFPFIFTDSARMLPLPTPAGLTFFPNGINDAGVVVGQSDGLSPFGADPGRAVIYFPGRGARDLNELVTNLNNWVIFGATGINQRGQIVGFASQDFQEFIIHAVLLNPVED